MRGPTTTWSGLRGRARAHFSVVSATNCTQSIRVVHNIVRSVRLQGLDLARPVRRAEGASSARDRCACPARCFWSWRTSWAPRLARASQPQSPLGVSSADRPTTTSTRTHIIMKMRTRSLAETRAARVQVGRLNWAVIPSRGAQPARKRFRLAGTSRGLAVACTIRALFPVGTACAPGRPRVPWQLAGSVQARYARSAGDAKRSSSAAALRVTSS